MGRGESLKLYHRPMEMSGHLLACVLTKGAESFEQQFVYPEVRVVDRKAASHYAAVQ
jgi:hypothetical protein